MTVKSDDAYFVKVGPLTTLVAIENVQQKSKLFLASKKTMHGKKDFEYELLKRLQTVGIRTLSKLLKECYEAESINFDEALYRKLQMSCTAFISAHKVPPFRQKFVSLSVVVDRSEQRFLYRVFCSRPLLRI